FTISGSAALFVFASVGLGPKWIFLNLTVDSDAKDGAVLSVLGSVVYTDRVANPMPPSSATPASLTVTAPVLRLAGSPAAVTVEAGTLVTFRVDLSNIGSGPAKDVWMNATLPRDLLFVSDSSDGTRTGMGSQITWHWPAFGGGSRAFNLTLALRSVALNGDAQDVSLVAQYTDSNGNLQSVPEVLLRANFIAPVVRLTLETSTETVATQTSFEYKLHLQNVGATIARTVWLADAVDDGLQVVSYTSSVPAHGGPDLNWTYRDLQPNEEQVIILRVQVRAGVAVGTRIPHFVTAVFTNSQGQMLGAAQSNPVVVTVIEANSPLPYIGATIAAAGAILGGALVYRRRNTRIEEVFLTTKDGILIDHLSRNLVQDKDPDIVSGMLMGIQRFVRDAFKFPDDRELHQMDFGGHHIVIERGKDIVLAAVTSGGGPNAIGAKLKKALDQIESEYGQVLAKFDGSMDSILGVRERLRDRLLA
ncbi:MAG TPA: hypothetical protein VFA17_02845, partial [Thermoplasmata archaeon]|nr:hypothetical protein [Thermoplasmata archaeon]